MCEIRLAIAGANGRMGQQLIAAVQATPGVKLGAALVREGSTLVNCDSGELAGTGRSGIYLTDDIGAVVNDFDLLIDFTRPQASLDYLAICCRHAKPVVLGTTGFDAAGKQQIEAAAAAIGIVFSANYSVGVNLLLTLLARTAQVIGQEADIEILEAHHRNKVDAPSGTALAMGEAIAGALDWKLSERAILSRVGHTGIRPPHTIGFATLRAGDIAGEHTAIFASEGERIELTHKATSRVTFATGAIRAAKWLMQQESGLYTMQEVLALT